jgi:hypothetical protein
MYLVVMIQSCIIDLGALSLRYKCDGNTSSEPGNGRWEATPYGVGQEIGSFIQNIIQRIEILYNYAKRLRRSYGALLRKFIEHRKKKTIQL